MTVDHEQPSDRQPVVVASFPDRGEAEVTLAHLRSAGIVGFIVDDIEGGALPVDGEGVRVLVHAEDADTARELLAPDAD